MSDWRLKAIDDHLQAAEDKASKYIEEEARKILDRHPNTLKLFILGMGTAVFYDEKGNPIAEEDRAYIANSPLMKFINRLDRVLYLTGEAMRIERGKPTLRDW